MKRARLICRLLAGITRAEAGDTRSRHARAELRWTARLRESSTSRRLAGLLLVFLTLSILPPDPLRAAEVLTFTHQGVARTAILHRPASTTGREGPLVIALHGFTATGEWLRAHLQLDSIADRERFVAVYPDAIDGAWSFGQPVTLPMPMIAGETVDDVGFMRILIDDLVTRKIADPKRIYVTGSSRGGFMTYTLACVLADRIAAAAPLIASMTEHQRDSCQPVRPLPIMVIAATTDPAMAFNGAQGKMGRLLSVKDTMEFWRSLHGCARVESKALPHRDPADATHVTLSEWSGCRTNVKLRLYQVDRGGHQLPSLTSGPSPMSEERWGRRNHDIETAEELWAFFRTYAAP